MTVKAAQIQATIAEIDAVLNQPASFPLGWLASKQIDQQRQVLERVRSNLVTLQQQLANTPAISDPIEPPRSTPTSASQQDIAELSALRQRRDALKLEIARLEEQRQNYLTSQNQANPQEQAIADFFQVLMTNLQENLTPQLSQTLSQVQSQYLIDQDVKQATNISSEYTEETAQADHPLKPLERSEDLRKQQVKLAKLLNTLDGKLNLMFETLQVNMQKYQTSFAQGLEKMHQLSEQNETMLMQVIDDLEQELENQSSEEAKEAATEAVNPAVSDMPYPYAGIEWISSAELKSTGEILEVESSDRQRDALAGTQYAGMAGLVSQTDELRSEPTNAIVKEEAADTIASLTDLIEEPTEASSSLDVEEIESLSEPDSQLSLDLQPDEDDVLSATPPIVAEDEEEAAIPDDILAEFDELFGPTTGDSNNPPPAPEKK